MTTRTYNFDSKAGAMRKTFVHSAVSSPTATGLGLGCAGALAVAIACGVPASHGPVSASINAEGKSFLITTSASAASKAGKSLASEGGDAPAWALDLEWLRFNSDVSISKLADLFGVTRKAVYAWMSGESEPRAGRVERIAQFRQVLSELETREERTFALKLVNSPLKDGSTIRSILSLSLGEQDVMVRLRDAFTELAPTIQQRARRAGNSSIRSRAFEADFPVV